MDCWKDFRSSWLRGRRRDRIMLQLGGCREVAIRTSYHDTTHVHTLITNPLIHMSSRISKTYSTNSPDSSRPMRPPSAGSYGNSFSAPNRAHKVYPRSYWRLRKQSSSKKRFVTYHSSRNQARENATNPRRSWKPTEPPNSSAKNAKRWNYSIVS